MVRPPGETFDAGGLCPSCETGEVEEVDEVLECPDCGYVIEY